MVAKTQSNSLHCSIRRLAVHLGETRSLLPCISAQKILIKYKSRLVSVRSFTESKFRPKAAGGGLSKVKAACVSKYGERETTSFGIEFYR